jgi:hypothetical protein
MATAANPGFYRPLQGFLKASHTMDHVPPPAAGKHFLNEKAVTMSTAYSYTSRALIKRLLIGLTTIIWFASCADDSLSAEEQDIAAFSRQLQGTWRLDKVTVTPARQSNSIVIAPVRDYACNKLSVAFKRKDVVSKYTISYTGNNLRVMKHFTCLLPPEELSWKIEMDGKPGSGASWMSGNNYLIREINEGTLGSKFKVLFFNLDNCAPDGKPATDATKNKLWLDVEYDTKENASTIRLEFSKD